MRYVARYYGKSDYKNIQPAEAATLAKYGIKLLAIYGEVGTRREFFSRTAGLDAGSTAIYIAHTTFHQPFGSAIFFVVDFDASADDIANRILPYFQGVHEAIAVLDKSANKTQSYRIGVYGSGLVINALFSRGLVDFRWLASATNWAGSADARETQTMDILQSPTPPALSDCGNYEQNVFRSGLDIDKITFLYHD